MNLAIHTEIDFSNDLRGANFSAKFLLTSKVEYMFERFMSKSTCIKFVH